MSKEIEVPEDYIEFDVEKEDWGFLKLEDGAILKIKFVLISLKKINDNYDANGQVLVGSLLPKSLRGPPSQTMYSEEELRRSIVNYDVKFEVLKQAQSIYNLSDGNKVYINLVVTQVMKTDKYNSRGEQIYIVNSVQAVKIIPLRNKP